MIDSDTALTCHLLKNGSKLVEHDIYSVGKRGSDFADLSTRHGEGQKRQKVAELPATACPRQDSRCVVVGPKRSVERR